MREALDRTLQRAAYSHVAATRVHPLQAAFRAPLGPLHSLPKAVQRRCKGGANPVQFRVFRHDYVLDNPLISYLKSPEPRPKWCPNFFMARFKCFGRDSGL
jgi:hypothetical protein